MEELLRTYRTWKFHNTALLTLILIGLFVSMKAQWLDHSLEIIGRSGYLGVLVVGMLFVSTFTVVPAAIVLFHFAETHNPFIVALIAGSGAVIGDYFIFRFFRDHVFEEISPFFKRIDRFGIGRILDTPYFAWMMPVLGALIVASPFPDEVGIGLMGISRLKNWQFLLITFLLNSTGILFVVTLAKSL